MTPPLLRLLSVAAATLFLASLTAHAADSLDALHQSIKTLAPGSIIELVDGTYTVATTKDAIKIIGKQGTEEKPIIIRAQHQGKAAIAGAAGFDLRDCAYIVIEGLDFTNSADQQAIRLENCHHVQVTRNTFHLSELAEPRHWEHWVTVDGAHSGQNRIDHNLFEHKTHRGSPLFVRGDDTALVCSQQDRIDHNYFREIIYANGDNGHETIRTGGNDLGASGRSSFTTIEDNLLEGCSGEEEIMSLKSSDNIVRNNTLLNCRGAISVRLGNRNVISGNFIIATGSEPDYGGIKLYGFDHRVFNNYFSGLTGHRHEAPFALVPGTLDTPTTDRVGAKYDSMTSAAPTHCWIAYNTWVDCSPLEFGFKPVPDRPYPPHACTFVNNLVVHTKPRSTPLVTLAPVRDLQAHDNLGSIIDAPPPTQEWSHGFKFADPQLRLSPNPPGLWRLTAQSPALGAATADPTQITEDLFGRPRPTPHDIGAEQFTTTPAPRIPLTPENVGPSAP